MTGRVKGLHISNIKMATSKLKQSEQSAHIMRDSGFNLQWLCLNYSFPLSLLAFSFFDWLVGILQWPNVIFANKPNAKKKEKEKWKVQNVCTQLYKHTHKHKHLLPILTVPIFLLCKITTKQVRNKNRRNRK